jgi:hypothetical protein
MELANFEQELNDILKIDKSSEVKILRIKKQLKSSNGKCKDINKILEYIRLYDNKIVNSFKCLKKIEEILNPF